MASIITSVTDIFVKLQLFITYSNNALNFFFCQVLERNVNLMHCKIIYIIEIRMKLFIYVSVNSTEKYFCMA